MAEHVKRVDRTTTTNGDVVETAREVSNPGTATAGVQTQNVISNIIWFAAGVLLVLLGFRFVLALLGANTSNSFANFIYNASHPFVSPFFSLFSYNTSYGVSKFEAYTLVAMLVYAVIAMGLTALININRPRA